MFNDAMAHAFIVGTLQDPAVRDECKTMLADFLKGLGVTLVTLELGESEELSGTPDEAAEYLAEKAYEALGVYQAVADDGEG